MAIHKLVEKIMPMGSYLTGIQKELNSRGDTPELPLNTLPQFSRKIWGLKKGLTILGARTSMGKSAMALQWAYDLANQSIPVLFLSLEMTVEQLIERLFCNIMEVDNYELMTGRYQIDSDIKAKWETFSKLVEEIPLLITCGVGKTFAEVNHLIELLNPKPKCIIIDYIQAISVKTKEAREDLNEYIRYFRQLCLENGVAGILCSQVNRSAGNEQPNMIALKSTGVLEEHADTVFLLHWKNFYDHNHPENEYQITISKQRNGRTGDYVLRFLPQYYRFEETLKEVEPQSEFTSVASIFSAKQVKEDSDIV